MADIELIADAIHYPGCWDTMAYPTLLDAIREIGCNYSDCIAEQEAMPVTRRDSDENV